MKNSESCFMLHITLHEVIKQAFRHQRSKKPFCVETHFQTTASFSEPISLFVAAAGRIIVIAVILI